MRTESMVHMAIHGPRNTADSVRAAKEAGATTLILYALAGRIQHLKK